MLAVGNEDVGGSQCVNLGAEGKVEGDGDLGGIVLADRCVWDDAVVCPFVLGRLSCPIKFKWGLEWFWRRGFVLGFCVRRYFGFDQVSWAASLWGPNLDGCRCCGLEENGGVGVQGGGSWLGVESVMVLVCPPNGVASLGVAVGGLGPGLLDG